MSEPHRFLDGRVTLYPGDCLDLLAKLPDNSVDSVVTDPPYHLTSIVKRFGAEGAAEAVAGATGAYKRAAAGFMGKQWDGGDIAFQPDTWRAVLRVLKPGGYILAFASSRGFGRMSVAIEDAGFINHPMFGWIFGSGFPKATRIKAEGFEGFRYGGQASKPALEPIYMGQKPFSEATGTANILRWGTGAVNIDGCRISDGADQCGAALGAEACGCGWPETACDTDRKIGSAGWGGPMKRLSAAPGQEGRLVARTPPSQLGRWPANIIHDGSDEVLAAFPDAGGQQRDIDPNAPSAKTGEIYGGMSRQGEASADRRYTDEGATNFAALPGERRGDSGSAARFFYSAKADAEDRIGSRHPTVKPLDLMQYLVRYITPPGGIVLDPFAGTGTTGEAAFREGMRAVLIEREPEYQADIARRMELAQNPTKRTAVAKTKNKLQGAEGTPLFGEAS